jgi:hypothetical protein
MKTINTITLIIIAITVVLHIGYYIGYLKRKNKESEPTINYRSKYSFDINIHGNNSITGIQVIYKNNETGQSDVANLTLYDDQTEMTRGLGRHEITLKSEK